MRYLSLGEILELHDKIIDVSGVADKGRKATFHRPHPGKDALRYRVSAARDFLKLIGVTP